MPSSDVRIFSFRSAEDCNTGPARLGEDDHRKCGHQGRGAGIPRWSRGNAVRGRLHGRSSRLSFAASLSFSGFFVSVFIVGNLENPKTKAKPKTVTPQSAGGQHGFHIWDPPARVSPRRQAAAFAHLVSTAGRTWLRPKAGRLQVHAYSFTCGLARPIRDALQVPLR